MRIPLIGGLRRKVESFWKSYSSKAVILMYHCIAERDFDPWKMCVTKNNFAEQLNVLKKTAYPISLNQLVQKLEKTKIPDRAVVVTFDDGYADNLFNAKPLLDQHNIPATVFVTSGYLKDDRGFWWDELEQIIMQPEMLPETLSLCINGENFHWNLSEAAEYNVDLNKQRTGWIFDEQIRKKIRYSLYFTLHQFLQPMQETDQRRVLDKLQTWAGHKSKITPKYPILSQEELVNLNQNELIEVGSHSVTHSFLSAQPSHLQEEEIRKSKLSIEDILGQQVKNFAYPYGNYNEEIIPLVRKAGFISACSIINGSVWSGSDRFQLPRFGVENWNGEEFEQRLSRMFNHH